MLKTGKLTTEHCRNGCEATPGLRKLPKPLPQVLSKREVACLASKTWIHF